MTTVVLLTLANIFMTIAWYGHLKFKGMLMWQAILIAWGIAFFEYCLQVPANRIGAQQWTVPQLKVLQEAITIVVFVVFVKLYFQHEPLKWNYFVAFGLIMLAVVFVFWGQWTNNA